MPKVPRNYTCKSVTYFSKKLSNLNFKELLLKKNTIRLHKNLVYIKTLYVKFEILPKPWQMLHEPGSCSLRHFATLHQVSTAILN